MLFGSGTVQFDVRDPGALGGAGPRNETRTRQESSREEQERPPVAALLFSDGEFDPGSE